MEPPPPRPPVRIAPIDLGSVPAPPLSAYVCAACWLISAVLVVPTALYAHGHAAATTDALFAELSPGLDPADIDAAHTLAQKAPTVVAAAALVLIVAQGLCAVVLVSRRSRSARWLLVACGVLGCLALGVWYYLLFVLGSGGGALDRSTPVVQALLLLAGLAFLCTPAMRRWLAAG